MITNLRQNWFIYLFLVVITLAVYSRVTEFEFVQFDDGIYVMRNDHVRTGLTAANICHALSFTQDALCKSPRPRLRPGGKSYVPKQESHRSYAGV